MTTDISSDYKDNNTSKLEYSEKNEFKNMYGELDFYKKK